MKKRTFISIEGQKAKAALIKKDIENADFIEFSSDEILDFIKENSIKEVYLSVTFPDLLTFRFSLPFQIPDKKKILEKIVFNEIRKRYPSIQNFSFMYETYIEPARSWIRCYVASEDSCKFIEELIEAKINIKALFSVHIPLLYLINSYSELMEKNRIVCFISGKSRFIFVFEKSEMVLSRQYETEENLTDEDIININMTVNYSVQNLRVQPEEIIFCGIKKQEISGLNLPYRFLIVLPETEKYSVPLSMALFEKELKQKNMLPLQYRRFKKTVKYLKCASFIMLTVTVFLTAYNASVLFKLKSLYDKMILHKQYIMKHEQEFFSIQNTLKNFEMNLKPLIELQNKRNVIMDARFPLYSLSQAKTELIQINSIEILSGQKPQIKIKGHSTGQNFSQRQISYLNFTGALTQNRLKIVNESWDITKGDFSIDAVYEHKGILQ